MDDRSPAMPTEAPGVAEEEAVTFASDLIRFDTSNGAVATAGRGRPRSTWRRG